MRAQVMKAVLLGLGVGASPTRVAVPGPELRSLVAGVLRDLLLAVVLTSSCCGGCGAHWRGGFVVGWTFL